MGTERTHSSGGGVSPTGVSRRQVLAAGGLLAVGGVSGCLSRAASATTNTGASPAAPFAGAGAYTGPSPAGDPTVYKLTPTVSTDVGDVELEAWVTATTVVADCCFDYNGGTSQTNRANYNNTRSNRSTIRGPDDPDSDADGVDDTVELRTNALDLENQLLAQTEAAADTISKRSARTGRNHVADMGGTIEDVRTTLERCSDDVCVTVREHADGRKQLTQQASAHVENGEWEQAAEAVRAVQRIVEGDIDLLESSLEGSEQSLGNPRLQELTGASDEDVAALYEYLAGEPVISERFTITVPDARLPGSGTALGDELTPRRIVEYVTGRADTADHLYTWGDSRGAAKRGGDSSSPIYEGEEVGGESAIHRGSLTSSGNDGSNPLYQPDAFSSYVSGPVDTGIHLDVVAEAGTVTVLPVNDPPQAAEATPALTVSADGSSEPANFDEWGPEGGASATTSTLVCPIVVAPPDCPSPFPALLYVRRSKHADQYVYTGGWVIDDGYLYRNSITALPASVETAVVSVGAGDVDGDGYGDVMARQLSGDGARRGARLFDGTVSDAVAEGVLSESGGNDILVRKRPGKRKYDVDLGENSEQDEGDDDGLPVFVTRSRHLSAPIVHLTGSNASDAVKFKAGAELSKSVN